MLRVQDVGTPGMPSVPPYGSFSNSTENVLESIRSAVGILFQVYRLIHTEDILRHFQQLGEVPGYVRQRHQQNKPIYIGTELQMIRANVVHE